MNYILNNSIPICILCFIVFIISSLFEYKNWLTFIMYISSILSAIFFLVSFICVIEFNSLVSSQTVIPYKVYNLTTSRADVKYSLDGVFREDTYYGPIVIDCNDQMPNVVVERRRNRLGDETIELKALVLPLRYID